jgi:FSR family fosmidomycin resistance protein-like MFS transporter
LAAVIAMGVGNAALHVAGGREALRRGPRKASAVGLFAAPGAIGLALGLQAPTLGAVWSPWTVVLAPAAAALVAAFGQARPSPLASADAGAAGWPGWTAVAASAQIVALVVFSLLRTVVGGVTPASWKTGAAMAVSAGVAAAAGKALGGPLGERFGLARVMGLSALGAALVVPWALGWAPGALAGLVLVNLSVAPVLAWLAEMVPGREGFVFGVGQACQFPLALLGGVAWPPWALAVCLAAMAALAGLPLRSRQREVG